MSEQRPAPDLQAICDLCLEPVDDGEGNVWVDTDAAANVARASADLGRSFDVGEMMALPEDAVWRTTHTACAQVPVWAYAIAVERIRTWQSFLHWSVHLMGKGWLAGTDWEMFVLRSLEPKQGAVSGLRPLRPQSLDWYGVGD